MRRVVIVGIEPVQELDLVGPLTVFTIANDLSAARSGITRPYVVEAVSGGSSRTIAGQSGIGLAVTRRFDEVRGSIDTLIVAGGAGALAPVAPELRAWLVRVASDVRRMASVCIGAFVLADVGLLRGRRATTHWKFASELARRHADVTVDPSPIWIEDGDVYTSAGICAGMDLALAMVERDHGSELALEVARHLIVYLRRPGDQLQFSVALASQGTDRREFRELAVWIAEHVRDDLRVPALAARAAMSERQFARAFARDLGMSPARYVERVRYEYARTCLETSDESLEAVAERCGFGSADVLRRTFVRLAGVTPKHYRDRFRFLGAARGERRYPGPTGAGGTTTSTRPVETS